MRLEHEPVNKQTNRDIRPLSTPAEILGGILAKPTFELPEKDKLPNKKYLGISSPAEPSRRYELLDQSSKLLTKEDPFTVADVFAFTDAIQEIAGSAHLDKSESLAIVPDIIPKTGVAKMSLHQRIDPDGASLNIVYQGAAGKPDTRYVIGEDFSRGVNYNTPYIVEFKSSEPDEDGTRPNENARMYPYSRRMDVNGVQLDPETDGRRICEDIYVAYLADAGRIEPNQAKIAKEILHEGTPITMLEPAK